MNHCKDCRHWGDEDDPRYEACDFKGTPTTDQRRRCLKVLFMYAEGADESLAVVSDASGYSAKLWVAPDFGCVLWEAAESAESESV